MKNERITLGHGSGAGLTQKLIRDVFNKNFKLPTLEDAVVIEGDMVVTTDAHVVRPLFFPGGDIGKLSITGTVNDLSMKGAVPKYILITYIIEEGFLISELKKITESVQKAAEESGVSVIAGDTKVVEKGKADGVYITTCGIGVLPDKIHLDARTIKAGDKIIINGSIGDHSVAVINSRENFKLTGIPESDCASLNKLVQKMLKAGKIKFMRDPTRGGVATVLNEVCADTDLGIIIEESLLPVKKEVRIVCELLGFDPLYLANEGKLLAFVGQEAESVLQAMKEDPLGADSRIIGEVSAETNGVYLKTSIGGLRPLLLLDADQLPRIC
ncbi:MAG: hydrogenase expression/formation protein HypE [Spirochaetes bacterium]|nr:hydrogenase expression/formation protein HypE [Spirochaetota bacterium]